MNSSYTLFQTLPQTIPIEIRKKLGIKNGDKILFVEEYSPKNQLGKLVLS
jgi:bifunctional DNA-binding transcriptional regulator/antitoxin component of YhaV-PrlF toxin-antitoxin module